MTYARFLEEIRKYRRDELIRLCSTTCWWIFSQPAERFANKRDHERMMLIRGYAPRVAAIAAAVGSDVRGYTPTERDLAWLCDRFLAIDEFGNQEPFDSQNFAKELRADTTFESFDLSDHLIWQSNLQVHMNRLLRSQWEFRNHNFDGIMRSWSLIKKLDARRAGSVLPRLMRFFNLEPVDAVRMLAVMFTFPNGFTPKGSINTRNPLFNEYASKAEVDEDILRLLLGKMSRSSEEFQRWHREIETQFEPEYRKYVPNPFVLTPMWRVAARGENHADYYSISPHYLLWGLSHTLSESVLNSTPDQERPSLLSDLGLSFEEYAHEAFKELCGAENVIDINQSLKDSGRKKADFLLLQGQYAIVVEIKRSISSALDRSMARPEGVSSTWGRLLESYMQCSAVRKEEIWQTNAKLGGTGLELCQKHRFTGDIGQRAYRL